jgi:uncharacterized protein (DUF433 family)
MGWPPAACGEPGRGGATLNSVEDQGMPAVVNNRIEGTRITVWTVYHYLEGGDWTIDQIAEVLGLSVEQVQAAVRYIEENKEEVLRVHREIEERNARGNPPHIQAMLDETHARFMARVEEARRKRGTEANGEGHRGGR